MGRGSRVLVATVAFVVLGVVLPVSTPAVEVTGFGGLEVRAFPEGPAYPGQNPQSGSAVLSPEFYWDLGAGRGLVVAPFLRIDAADTERTHADIRELLVNLPEDAWELRAGIGKVFWGSTEFLHLVDIINQTDLIEDLDEEEKLGQPMVHVSLYRSWGIVEAFVLPGFRERTFSGRSGRLRPVVVVDTDNPRYESAAEETHIDVAARYSHTLGDADFGLYYFTGTGREPTLIPSLDGRMQPVLVPFYPQIGQTGLDLQAVAGNWLWKLEALYRTGQGPDFFASVGGLEYSLVNVLASGMDIGLIAEWAYDERGDTSTRAFQNDVMLGLRWARNDPESTEILAGVIYDLDVDSQVFTLEASRRLGNRWRVSLDAYVFRNVDDDPILRNLDADDVIRWELRYYF